MILEFNIILLVLLVITAVIALQMRDILSSIVILGLYSFLLCLLWSEMDAVDVSFTEAAVGAGASTVLMIATIYKTTRRSSD